VNRPTLSLQPISVVLAQSGPAGGLAVRVGMQGGTKLGARGIAPSLSAARAAGQRSPPSSHVANSGRATSPHASRSSTPGSPEYESSPGAGRHEDRGRPPELALRSSSSAIPDRSSAVVRNVPFASTSKDFRAALLQRSASSRRRPEQSVSMGSRSRLVDWGACPDWCKIRVTWFDHLAGQNVACRWSHLTLDGLDRFNKGARMTGSQPSQLKRVPGAQ
jgi:hypothetical protein